jgi:hypothetical protein
MESAAQEINFRTVSQEARVSTAWLYAQPALRERIERSRSRQQPGVASAETADSRERSSRENIVAALRLRIKALEEKNRELTEFLEIAYGELAQLRETQDSARRLHVNDVPSRSSSKKTLASYR